MKKVRCNNKICQNKRQDISWDVLQQSTRASTIPVPQTGLRLSWESWRWLRNWSMMSWCPVPSLFLWPFTGLVPACPCLCFTGEPHTALHMCFTSAVEKRKTSFNQLATLLLMQPRMLVAFFATSAHFCLFFLFLSNWTACIFFSKAALQTVSP